MTLPKPQPGEFENKGNEWWAPLGMAEKDGIGFLVVKTELDGGAIAEVATSMCASILDFPPLYTTPH